MKIIVINPNSSDEMTVDIQHAAKAYGKDRIEICTVKTEGAPEFIDTFEDAALAAPGMMKIVRENVDADAFVVACHCDPNLNLLREITTKPVIGIGEASMKLATMLGASFTVLSTAVHSVPNKLELIRRYRLEKDLASIRVVESGVESELVRYTKSAKKAMEEDLAEVIILGCAGLCTLAEEMEEVIGIPVLDGVVCGVMMAEGICNMNQKTSKIRYYSGL